MGLQQTLKALSDPIRREILNLQYGKTNRKSSILTVGYPKRRYSVPVQCLMTAASVR